LIKKAVIIIDRNIGILIMPNFSFKIVKFEKLNQNNCMRPIYLRKDNSSETRKVMIDMAYLVSHKKIRLLKFLWEEGLYLPFIPNKSEKQKIENYYLTKDKLIKEGENHYFFDFPFKPEQVENTAN